MAAIRRGQAPMKVDLSTPEPSNDVPPISALFLIYFDHKVGYKLGWKRSLPGVELEGVVEYKSLPSGLHKVEEDLIYFIHEGHAGMSAFVNAPAAEAERNASMIAVGIMVPLTYGRLGRCWRYADRLKEIASELVCDTSKTNILEEFWDTHGARDASPVEAPNSLPNSPSISRLKAAKSATTKPRAHGRNRSASDGLALNTQEHTLSSFHPARSLFNLMDTFGPLMFPIYRAAILRKRILITSQAPVKETCNFVYDLSILSNIPLSALDMLPSDAPPQRLRPLFCIGVHDIPMLEDDLRASKASRVSDDDEIRERLGSGWIACTTDSILAMKTHLYDILITLPPSYSSNAKQQVWPKVESPKGTSIKATQRDLRRYKSLRWGLSRHQASMSSSFHTNHSGYSDDDDENPFPISGSYPSAPQNSILDSLPDTDSIIEASSWSSLAYSGFMWWASSGEQRLQSEYEAETDAALLSGLLPSPTTPRVPLSQSFSSLGSRLTKEEGAEKEMAVIAYFHRLTSLILTIVGENVDAMDDEGDEGFPFVDRNDDDGGNDNDEAGNSPVPPAVYISSADMTRMGLDVWSAADYAFVDALVGKYFGRRAEVEGRTVDICGVRIC